MNDDLLFINGSLLIGVLGAGKVAVLAPGKPLTELPIQIPAVEGMIYIGQKMYAAGQAQDVVDEVAGSQVRTVLQLRPVAGLDGVDGITAQGGQRPRGVVDWVDPATGGITKQVGGFVRPTGAWPAVDGSLLVADEFGNAAVKIAPDGTRSYLIRGLPVNTGGRLVQLVGGVATDLVSRLSSPQGLAVDGADKSLVQRGGRRAGGPSYQVVQAGPGRPSAGFRDPARVH
jgi:hypothetical protein